MKKKIVMFTLFILMFFYKSALADQLDISTQVIGKIEKGESIQILINIKDIKSFFAGSAKLKYDKSAISVKSIEPGELISKKEVNKFEAINKVDDENGILEYAFSALGKVNGFSGGGTFIKINAKVLENKSFHINSKPFLKDVEDEFNLKLQICDSNITELNYNFTPYVYKVEANNTGSNQEVKTENNKTTDAPNTPQANPSPDSNTINATIENQTQTPAPAETQNASDISTNNDQSLNEIKEGEGSVSTENNSTSNEEASSESAEVKKNNSKLLWIAAISVIIIFLAGFITIKYTKKKKSNNIDL